MSLLDFLGTGADDPRSGQILGLAQGLLSAPGGRGLAAGIQGMQQARQDDMRRKYLQGQMDTQSMQNDAMRRQVEQDRLMREAAAASYRSPEQAAALSTGPMPDGGAVQPVPAGFDATGYVNRLYALDPMKAIQVQQAMAKDSQFNKIDPKDFTAASLAKFAQSRNYGDLVRQEKLEFKDTGGKIAGLDPFTGRQVAEVGKTGNPFDDLVLSNGTGGFVPNQPLLNAKQAIAKSGAASTSVRIENKMGEGLASQIGPMLRESTSVAEGAAKQIDAANRIIGAVDKNKMFAGTGASIGLTAAQVADTLGIAGAGTKEKIENTRQAIQGLSQLTLQGRAQMRGQGAITESESKLAERAVSGDISMTPAEIKQLANAAKRAAGYMQSEHQRKLSTIKNNPDLAGMVPFYDVAPVPAEAPAPTKPNFRFEGGKLIKVD
jgi:hypothetical protein